MTLKQLQERKRELLLKMKPVVDKAQSEGRAFTEAEEAEIEPLAKELDELESKIKKAQDDAALQAKFAGMIAGLPPAEPDVMDVAVGIAKDDLSWGETFVQAKEWRDWYKRMAPNGMIPEGTHHFTSPPLAARGVLKSLFGRKTLLTGSSDTSAGAFVTTDYTGIYEPLGRRVLGLLDLVSRRATASDTVSYTRQTAKVTQAAPVQEANVTTYSGASGEIEGEKPEGAMTFEAVTATVKTIAVWIPATKRALADVGQLRGMIDQELRADVVEDLEDEIWSGDGTGEHFTGITNTSGVLTYAYDTDILETAHKAMTYVFMTSRVRPTAFLFNPYDIEKIELMRDNDGRFYGNGPFASGPRTLWGLPMAEAEVVDEGSGVVAAFNRAIVWDREQAAISVSDSHNDFFIRNLVAILCELRAAFGITKPNAFCIFDTDAS